MTKERIVLDVRFCKRFQKKVLHFAEKYVILFVFKIMFKRCEKERP